MNLKPRDGPTVRVELVHDGASRHVDVARDVIRAALSELGLPPDWVEWDRHRFGRRDAARYFGPSNVLVNGEPVVDASHSPEIWDDGRGSVLVREALVKALQKE